MLDPKVRRKLESITQLPTIPFIITDVLHAVDNNSMSAAAVAQLVEKDQTLAARVLRVANSPLYGFSRRIATIELAIVVLGLNVIKEIVMSLIVQRFFAGVRRDVFDVKAFWLYSVFCGSAARYIARKLKYKLAGEAFVAGLMHDIGFLVIIQYFTKEFAQVRNVQASAGYSLLDAEKAVLQSSHCEIGEWLAENWKLPQQLLDAISGHHNKYVKKVADNEDDPLPPLSINTVEKQLAVIVSLAEWFADKMGYKVWAMEIRKSPLYIPEEIFRQLLAHEILDEQSSFEIIKQELNEEFQKAAVLVNIQVTPAN